MNAIGRPEHESIRRSTDRCLPPNHHRPHTTYILTYTALPYPLPVASQLLHRGALEPPLQLPHRRFAHGRWDSSARAAAFVVTRVRGWGGGWPAAAKGGRGHRLYSDAAAIVSVVLSAMYVVVGSIDRAGRQQGSEPAVTAGFDLWGGWGGWVWDRVR